MIAVDSTGFTQSNASRHYVKRLVPVLALVKDSGVPVWALLAFQPIPGCQHVRKTYHITDRMLCT